MSSCAEPARPASRRRPGARGRRLVLGALIGLAGLALALPAAGPAEASTSACADALTAAAARHGVPETIILAIGRVESGFNPYAINAAGTPHFADSAADAIAYVEARQAEGMSSIDVGCGQVNLMWHPTAFSSLADAFTPAHNADYAARLLATLYDAHGNWTSAVAHYHSGTRVHQERYLAAIRRALGDGGAALIDPTLVAVATIPAGTVPDIPPASPHHVELIRLGIDRSERGAHVAIFRAPVSAGPARSATGPRTVAVTRVR